MASKLILTIRAGLETKYGTSGFADIEAKLGIYRRADVARGLTTRILYGDDPARTGFGFPGVSTSFPGQPSFPPDESGPNLNASIREVNTFCRSVKSAVDAAWNEFQFDYLMILGGNDVVPFFRAPNPLQSVGTIDPDTTVPTDNPYGAPSLNANLDPYSFLLPEIPTGRMPDVERATDPAYLLSVMDESIAEAAREQHGQILTPDGWGVTADVWEALSLYLALQTQIPLSRVEISPPVALGSFPTSQCVGRNVHYFNLHGALGTGVWSGESTNAGFVDTFGPAQIQSIQLPKGTGVVTETCYGSDLLSRQVADSCGLTYLSTGCSTFMGSTTIAYGAAAPPAFCADLIAGNFLDSLITGSSTGNSLIRAKQNIASTTTPFGGLTPAEMKTLFQFCLLGDPSHHPFQCRIQTYLTTVRKRREALREISSRLRGYLIPLTQAKARGVRATAADLPETGKIWQNQADARLPGLDFRGELIEVFTMQVKPLSNLRLTSLQPQRVTAVHRLYRDPNSPKVTDPQARIPNPIYLASAYFTDDRLLRESLVKSR